MLSRRESSWRRRWLSGAGRSNSLLPDSTREAVAAPGGRTFGNRLFAEQLADLGRETPQVFKNNLTAQAFRILNDGTKHDFMRGMNFCQGRSFKRLSARLARQYSEMY
ncbi:hypothetical protein, partial [Desulfovibrio sp.]|uniref:hypothetical protein n=1 Tax=Desulfovibrio sp. TaxID=885 RepID=UPI0025C26C30